MTPVMKIFVILLGEAGVWSRILENAHLKMDPVTGKKNHISVSHIKKLHLRYQESAHGSDATSFISDPTLDSNFFLTKSS